ncbi:MAG: histidine phosphatase family protein [Tepidiformaceae bacterium]
MAVILVQHAMAQAERGVPSARWVLSEAAKEDCVLLAHALPQNLGPVVYSSGKPKASETAAVIALRRGLRTETDERLREVDQPPDWVDDYRAIALAYLAGSDGFGWEPPAAVARRVSAAVDDAMEGSDGVDVILVSHGLAISIWVAQAVGSRLPAFELATFWRELTFPDAWRVDARSGTLQRVLNAGMYGA